VLEFLRTAGVVGLAEFGDKTQLLCMVFAGRYKPRVVIAGAAASFLLLNLLSVLVGEALERVVPRSVLGWATVGLLAAMGGWTLWSASNGGMPELKKKPDGRAILTVFLAVALAEFGDKTQLVVAALATRQGSVATWLGAATGQLIAGIIGVYFGRWLLQRVPVSALQRVGGAVFLGFASWLALGLLA